MKVDLIKNVKKEIEIDHYLISTRSKGIEKEEKFLKRYQK